MKINALCLMVVLAACATDPGSSADDSSSPANSLDLGNFSVSLTVKDLAASRAFYEKLGFVMFADTTAQNYLILQNGTTTVGLFQGMFEKNMLTFNPGWTNKAQTLERFTDVRDIQKTLVSRGIQPLVRADEASSGPASLVLVDPDGNPILIDQHVPRPATGQ